MEREENLLENKDSFSLPGRFQRIEGLSQFQIIICQYIINKPENYELEIVEKASLFSIQLKTNALEIDEIQIYIQTDRRSKCFQKMEICTKIK